MLDIFKKKNRVRTIHEVFEVLRSKEELKNIIDEHRTDELDIEIIYDTLVLCGAGQYVDGYYVASQSLVTPQTLKLILTNYRNREIKVEGMDHYTSMFFITDQVLEHFHKN